MTTSYHPKFQVTPATIKLLGKIEAAKNIVEELDLPLSFEQAFRKEELLQTASRAGLRNCMIKRRWPYRLLLVAEPFLAV